MFALSSAMKFSHIWRLALLSAALVGCVTGRWAGTAADDAGDGGEAQVDSGSSGGPGGPGDAGASVRCSAPLAVACDNADCPPVMLASLPGPWCSRNPSSQGLLGECGGYNPLIFGGGTDSPRFAMYTAEGGTLAAIVQSPDLNGAVCVGGSADFAIPLACFHESGPGVWDSFDGSGAGGACTGYDAGPIGDATPD